MTDGREVGSAWNEMSRVARGGLVLVLAAIITGWVLAVLGVFPTSGSKFAGAGVGVLNILAALILGYRWLLRSRESNTQHALGTAAAPEAFEGHPEEEALTSLSGEILRGDARPESSPPYRGKETR